MYINRALLLVVGVVMIFFPALEDWVFNVETAWYRPFQLWLLVVVASYCLLRSIMCCCSGSDCSDQPRSQQ